MHGLKNLLEDLEKGEGQLRIRMIDTDAFELGDMGVFLDENDVQGLEAKMEERGHLDDSQMAGTFNLMRANDLIWSFYINNYLLGNDPRPFDLLY